MRLSPIYEQRLAEATQQGCRIMIENLLKVRFGELNQELSEIIEPLSALSPEEVTPLLLQLSQEELLQRFG